VVTDTAVTVKDITFDNANTYVIAGSGSVALASDTNTSTISVLEGSHKFQTVVNLSNATDVDVAASSSLAFNNALNLGGNTLTKTGAGTMNINNILNTGGGSVVAAAGIVSGNGLIDGNLDNSGATVAPGNSPGTLSVGGDYTQAADASLDIEIGGTDASQFDQLNVTDTLAITGGNLDLLLTDGFVPTPGDTFDILDFNSAGGAFDEINGTPGMNMAWDASDLFTTGELSAISVLRGDMDGNLLVNLGDVSLLIQALVDRTSYEPSGFPLDADFNGDVNSNGSFDLGDLGAFSALFGIPASTSSLASASAEASMALAVDEAPFSTILNTSASLRTPVLSSEAEVALRDFVLADSDEVSLLPAMTGLSPRVSIMPQVLSWFTVNWNRGGL